jgi:hypothetical protein
MLTVLAHDQWSEEQLSASHVSVTFNSNMYGSDQLPCHPQSFHQLLAVGGGQCSGINQTFWNSVRSDQRIQPNAGIKEMEIKKGIKTDWGRNKKVKQKKSNKEVYL